MTGNGAAEYVKSSVMSMDSAVLAPVGAALAGAPLAGAQPTGNPIVAFRLNSATRWCGLIQAVTTFWVPGSVTE